MVRSWSSYMAQSTASSSLSSTQYDDSSDDGQGPSKKRKRYSCVFRKHLSKTFPWSTESKRGRSFAFCVRCNRDISMGQGSVKDLKRHEQRNPASELCLLARISAQSGTKQRSRLKLIWVFPRRTSPCFMPCRSRR